MSLWAIIPVKFFGIGKSRLARILNIEQRQTLISTLLKHTILVLKEIPIINKIVIVTADKKVKKIVKESQVGLVTENGFFGLNWAVAKAVHKARLHSINDVLILPIDLPFLCVSDIKRFIDQSKLDNGIVISPDRFLSGTNSLLLRTAAMIPMRFGKNSFNKHLHEANKRDLPVYISNINSFTFDLDKPDDYDYYQKTLKETKITQILVKPGE